MEFVDSLDEIPPMSYDLIDFTKYKNLTRYHGEVTAKTITTAEDRFNWLPGEE